MFAYSSWAAGGSIFRSAKVILKFPVFQVLRHFLAPSQVTAYDTPVGWNGSINQGDFLFSPFSFMYSLFARICLSAVNVSMTFCSHTDSEIHCVRAQCTTILLLHIDNNGSVRVKWIAKKLCVKAQNGFICLRMVLSGGLLWAQWGTVRRHQQLPISWLAARLLCPQAGQCCMDRLTLFSVSNFEMLSLPRIDRIEWLDDG
jgi:hypothetical protein